MARLSEYKYELCVEICKRIEEGENIKQILSSKNKSYPDFTTWCRWKNENDELHNLYTRSIQNKAEMIDAKIDEILDEVRTKKLEVPQARLIIDTLKWKAGKYYPKMFGDKVDLTSDGKELKQNAPITIQINGNNLELE